jgi:hypothetical protein
MKEGANQSFDSIESGGRRDPGSGKSGLRKALFLLSNSAEPAEDGLIRLLPLLVIEALFLELWVRFLILQGGARRPPLVGSARRRGQFALQLH